MSGLDEARFLRLVTDGQLEVAALGVDDYARPVADAGYG